MPWRLAESHYILASKIDTTKMKAPSFLMILTGTTKYAIRREDGVYVVPVGCLKNKVAPLHLHETPKNTNWSIGRRRLLVHFQLVTMMG